MSLSRAQVLAALPCYVCGDLPAEVQAQVRAQVEADPQLQAQVRALEASRALCEALLRRPAPHAAGAPLRGGVVPAPVSAGLAAVALLALIVEIALWIL